MMFRRGDILSKVRVASPCSQSWEAMEGTDRSRYCGACRQNVYNLSAMTKEEAARLIHLSEGRVCVRYYQRADGTVLTSDCPAGLRAARRKLAYALSCGTVMFLGLYSSAWRMLRDERNSAVIEQVRGEILSRLNLGTQVLGEMAPMRPEPHMGSPAFEPPDMVILGKIALPEPNDKVNQ